MAVKTRRVTLSSTRETSLGVVGGSPEFLNLEPNAINSFGASITTEARNPLGTQRRARKGTVVDLNSGIEFTHDATLSCLREFLEGFMFASFSTGIKSWEPTAVTATGYTVASGGDVDQYTLVYARGFTNSANNGLKVVGAASTSTEVKTSGLTVEGSPPSNCELEVCGVQGATGDIEIDASGNIISTALDLSALGLTVGQYIKIGGSDTDTYFATAANNGYARIIAIDTNELTLDRKSGTFATDAGTGKTIQLFFGPFVKDLDVDDGSFLIRSYYFELAMLEGLDSGVAEYEYSKGNYCNQMTFNLPLTSKALMTLNFMGTDTPVPTTSRQSGGTWVDPNQTEALNTSSDILRLRVIEADETGLTTYFKNTDFTLSNNVSPEKALGTLGAVDMNYGSFGVGISGEAIFTNSDVVSAIRNNTTVGMDFFLQNNDGGIHVDIPSMTLGDGAKTFPENEVVRINLAGSAFGDATLGYALGVTYFPYLPAAS
jgi:hypothetical protein